MTKEINSLTARELRTLQNATSVLKKAYGLSDEDIDSFFALVRQSGALINALNDLSARVSGLERALRKDTDEKNRSDIESLVKAFNAKSEEFRL